MTEPTYFSPAGGLPAQTELMTGRAVFTEAYAVIPRGVYSDIVASLLPHWTKTLRVGDRTAPFRIRRDILPVHHGRSAGRRQ